MELTKYLSNLLILTEDKQIKWVRRPDSGPNIYDYKTENSTLSIVYSIEFSKIYMVITGEDGNTISLNSLSPIGEAYNCMLRLWDIIVSTNVEKILDNLSELLPKIENQRESVEDLAKRHNVKLSN